MEDTKTGFVCCDKYFQDKRQISRVDGNFCLRRGIYFEYRAEQWWFPLEMPKPVISNLKTLRLKRNLNLNDNVFFHRKQSTTNKHSRSQFRKTVMVWFRDVFRLDDHLALMAAVKHFDSYLLPIIIVPCKVSESPSLAAIVQDLACSLQKLGSGLVVIENGDCAKLQQLIVTTETQKVYISASSECFVDFRLSSLQERLVFEKFHSLGLHYHLIEDRWREEKINSRMVPMSCPHVLPSLPESCSPWLIASINHRNISQRQVTETNSLFKLQRILKYLIIDDFNCFLSIFHWTCKQLKQELLSGVISKVRICYELEKRRYSIYLSPPLLSPALASNCSVSAMAYDIEGNVRRTLEWDEKDARFRYGAHDDEPMDWVTAWKSWLGKRTDFLKQSFFPEGITSDYYAFTFWRVFQRLVSATVGVFGTQALLLALGIKAGRIGRAAATSWVLKDGFGRLGKMFWASQMGRDFDADPKRWRFRSALLYAFGNGLEIVTQIFPASFLIFATLANSMKQISMLTASATRNAMYKNFAGRSENIADITAKGEAQIVVADLLGMAIGIQLSKWIGTSRPNVLTAYSILSVLDIYAIYKELRAVQFRTLNYERSGMIVDYFISKGHVPSPSVVSQRENIFLKPRHDIRPMFATLSEAISCPEELNSLVRTFKGEQFIVTQSMDGRYRIVLREHAKNNDILRALLTLGFLKQELYKESAMRKRKPLGFKLFPFLSSFEDTDCWWSSSSSTERHHSEDWTPCQLKNRKKKQQIASLITTNSVDTKQRMIERMDAITSAYKQSKQYYMLFIQQLQQEGWSVERLLYGPVKRRAVW
eukprot:jgi/Galph1/1264/GphlegSOOS_G5967.1